MVDAHLNSWNSLEKDSLKKSLNSQSSLGSCFSLAPQGDSQLIKWARDLPWMRWRSINTPHQVQGPATRIPQKTSASDVLNVAPGALHRASGTPLTASCTCNCHTPNTQHRVRCPTETAFGEAASCSLSRYRTGRTPAGPVHASSA